MIKQNRSLSRGLRILRVFNEEPRPTLTRIAASVELDKTTCRRFLLTLQEEGYVEYDETLKRYQLRPLVLELGFAALGSMSVPKVAAPYMQDLANQTGGALNLSKLEGDEVVLVGRAVAEAEKRKLVTMNLHVGMRLPAHCTAMGRILIGTTQRDVSDFVQQMAIQQVVASTLLADPAHQQIIYEQQQGAYTVIEHQIRQGVSAIAVPLNGGASGLFALAVSVTTGDYSREQLIRDVLPPLQAVQTKLERIFAMTGST